VSVTAVNKDEVIFTYEQLQEAAGYPVYPFEKCNCHLTVVPPANGRLVVMGTGSSPEVVRPGESIACDRYGSLHLVS
jgi:hypothetical protein